MEKTYHFYTTQGKSKVSVSGVVKNNELQIGWAKAPVELFNKKLGRQISLGRASKADTRQPVNKTILVIQPDVRIGDQFVSFCKEKFAE